MLRKMIMTTVLGAVALGLLTNLTMAANSIGTVATPVLNPSTTFTAPSMRVSIACPTSGATIRYTTNGSNPTSSSLAYTGPLTLSATTVVKAQAFKNGMNASPIATATYTLLVAQAPVAAANTAECTTYVAAVRCLKGYPNAFQWVTTGYLARNGYRQVATPVSGAIVVYQPGVNGTDSNFGHVAFVVNASMPDGAGRITFTIRGAHQGTSNVAGYPPNFTDAGFSNVSVRSSSIARGQANITFWVK